MPLLLRLLATVTALGTLTLGGCRDDPRTVRDSDGRVDFVLDEYRLDPQVVSVAAGEVTFRARNVGRLTHNVRVIRRRDPLGGTDTLRPGGSTSETFRLRRGDYRIVCTIANHDVLGMRGRLQVR